MSKLSLQFNDFIIMEIFEPLKGQEVSEVNCPKKRTKQFP